MRKVLFLAAFSLATFNCSGSNGGTGGGSATGGGSSAGGGSAVGGGSAAGGGSATGGGTSDGGGGIGGGTGGGTSDGGGGIGGGTGGGGGGAGITCHFTRDAVGNDGGSADGGGECIVQAALDNNPPGVAFTVRDSNNAAIFAFAGTIDGATTFSAGTYTLADIPVGGGVIDECVAICNNGGCADGAGNGIPNYGTFTIHVTDPGPAQMGALWNNSHGDATLNMIAVPATPCSGTDTVSVTW
ncbi:MAG: hypothetical protein QM723_37515 [Myxococcaceae bacterium]